jgi:tRNA threonylcarbamoyladenosine biosynthesis protein TsaE
VQDVVTSPTYAIVNEYAHDHGKIFHIDLYRLKNEEEVLQSGVQDCIYSGHICFIEWPEKAPGIFPDDTINVFIQSIDEHSRSIRILEN